MRCSPQINFTVQRRMAGLLDVIGRPQLQAVLVAGTQGQGILSDAFQFSDYVVRSGAHGSAP
jgi:hypothetical protein